MGKTYRRLPYTYYRSFKNYHSIIKHTEDEDGVPKMRTGAIPPSPYDDFNFNKEVYTPLKVCRDMFDEGVDDEEIVKRIHRKFKIPAYRIQEEIDDIRQWKRFEERLRRNKRGKNK